MEEKQCAFCGLLDNLKSYRGGYVCAECAEEIAKRSGLAEELEQAQEKAKLAEEKLQNDKHCTRLKLDKVTIIGAVAMTILVFVMTAAQKLIEKYSFSWASIIALVWALSLFVTFATASFFFANASRKKKNADEEASPSERDYSKKG